MKRPVFFLVCVLTAASLACNISVGAPATAPTAIIIYITETSLPSATPMLVITTDTASPTATVASATFVPPSATWTPTFTATWTPTSTNTPVPPVSGIAAKFVHTASAGNTSSNHTNINNSLTNGNPNSLVFITANWNPGGSGGTYDNAATGVWYNTSKSKWSIFNQNISAMPISASFNVLIPGPGTPSFVHTATAGNTIDNYTDINNPLTNNNPNAIVFVTPNWNPGGAGGTYDNSAIGVWYNASTNRWSIYNQNLSAMPLNASFNVMILSAGGRTFVHTADGGNIQSNYTYIDRNSANNHPNALVFVTANWNPGGVGGTYNTSPIGVWYDNAERKWSIFNQDFSAMPANASFNVIVVDP